MRGEAAIVIRDAASDEDFELVRALFREYADSLGFDLCFQNFAEEVANLPGDYERPAGCVLLADVDGECAGCVALRPFSGGVCEMKRLYVRAACRGLGVGRALAGEAIARARRAGYEALRLDTVSTMSAANSLYRSLGFLEIPQYRPNPIEGARYFELALAPAGPGRGCAAPGGSR